jgi:hypothetical protein
MHATRERTSSLSNENGVLLDITHDEGPSKIKKDLVGPESESCYSVSFDLRISAGCNPPNMVAHKGIDEVIRDLEAKSTNVVRYRHKVGRISPPRARSLSAV